MEQVVLEEKSSNSSEQKRLSGKVNESEDSSQVLTCIYSNLQSLLSKKKEIEHFLDTNKVHLMFFTECWVDETHQPIELYIPGFQEPIIHLKKRGGACIYVSDTLAFEEVTPPNKVEDSVWLKISTEDKTTRLYACIYKSPNSSHENNQNLNENLEWASNRFKEVIIVGDFNLPDVNWTNNSASSACSQCFLETLTDSSYCQLVTENTRFRSGQNPSLLDLVLVSDPNLVSSIEYLEPFGKSDHCTLRFVAKNKQNLRKNMKQKLNHKKIDNDSFRERITAHQWDGVFSEENDFHDAYEFFNDISKNAIKECTPVYKTQEMRRAPWSTKLIGKLADKKRRQWDKYRRTEDPADYSRYQDALNEFTAAKNRAINNYENNVIANKKTSPKRYYKYVSLKNRYNDTKWQLEVSGNTTSDEVKCADGLIDFFASSYTKGKSKMPHIPPEKFNTSEICDLSITREDIKKRLDRLDVSKATGSDEIPALILRNNSDIFSEILYIIFRRSYTEGTVPRLMKAANVVPIFKKGNKKSLNNYRPISLNPIISKIFEEIVKDSIQEFAESEGLFNEAQHGFRRNRSTGTNLVEFWEDITDIVNNNKDLSIVYTDFKKAFDSVPHDLLLLKLKRLGIRGKTLKWLHSYLEERTQRVILNDVTSRTVPVESGVPQGGVLSGLLFALYIDDITDCFLHSKVLLYADDAKIYTPIDNSNDVMMLQEDLDRLAQWCDKWRIRLSPEKCHFLHHGQRMKNKSIPINYSIGGSILKRESKATDLGIIVTDDLKWHEQVKNATSKAITQINIIRRTFKSRNPAFLSNMYKLRVRPHLEYAVEVWNPQYQGDILMMEKVQNKMTRLLRRGRILTPDERNSVMNLTTHQERRLRGDLINTYKRIDLDTLFSVKPSGSRSKNSKTIKSQYSRTDIKRHALSRRIVKAWNELPDYVVTSKTVNEFKSKLDKHMDW